MFWTAKAGVQYDAPDCSPFLQTAPYPAKKLLFIGQYEPFSGSPATVLHPESSSIRLKADHGGRMREPPSVFLQESGPNDQPRRSENPFRQTHPERRQQPILFHNQA